MSSPRTCLLTALAMLAAAMTFAEPLTADQVRAATETWVRAVAAVPRPDARAERLDPYPASGRPAAYVVHLAGGGYCLAGADDRLLPVTYYQPTDAYDSRIPDLAYLLDDYVRRLDRLETAADTSDPSLASTFPPVLTPPLTSTWDQDSPYNDQRPVVTPGSDEHVVVGCVATAAAQVMKYWQWPPIMMTTIAALVGTLPIALGFGAGAPLLAIILLQSNTRVRSWPTSETTVAHCRNVYWIGLTRQGEIVMKKAVIMLCILLMAGSALAEQDIIRFRTSSPGIIVRPDGEVFAYRVNIRGSYDGINWYPIDGETMTLTIVPPLPAGLALCDGNGYRTWTAEGEGNGWYRFDIDYAGGVNAPLADEPCFLVAEVRWGDGDDESPLVSLDIATPDLTGDLRVDISDLPRLASILYGEYSKLADYDFNGVVNLSDIPFFAAARGRTCAGKSAGAGADMTAEEIMEAIKSYSASEQSTWGGVKSLYR